MLARLLVTGGAGFIGQNLVHWLSGRNPRADITVLDALTYAANPTSLQPLIDAEVLRFVQGDISDISIVRQIFKEQQFNAVMHLAAESHVDRSIVAPDRFIETNIIGTYNLLKCAHEAWQERGILGESRFLHVSTDEVYGDLEADDAPFTEQSPYRPSSPYSASKASSDHLVHAFGRTFDLPVVVTNCSNNYGPYQHPEKLIPLMTINALEGRALPIYGDGKNIRDWLHVEDHCRALYEVLTRARQGTTYNIGGRTERTNADVVMAICLALDRLFDADPLLAGRYPSCPAAYGKSCSSLISYVRDRPGHDRRYAVDASALQKELGVGPLQSFDSGLAQTVSWYVYNEPWWRQAMSADFRAWVEANYGNRAAAAQRPQS